MNDKQKNAATVNVRAAALGELLRCAEGDTFVNIALDGAIKRLGLEARDRDFFTALVYGVIERQITLDYYISKLSSKPIKKLDAVVLTALRMGIYQIIYMDKVPNSAACNESVKLVKKKAASAAPFVNAVLRSFIRRRDEIELPDREADLTGYLSVRYSVPRELVLFFTDMYGAEKAESILEGMDAPPAVTLRVNTLRTGRDKLLAELSAAGIEAVASPEAKYGIRLLSSVSVGALAPLKEGRCIVQDDASSLSVEALAPRPGDTLIDMCAAPGGKSISAAMMMENKGKIFSFDIYENKLVLINESAERLGIDIINTEVSDGAEYRPELAESADRVICDVPCSGFGVLAKKPDMRLRAAGRIESAKSLPELQYKILCNAASYLKRGGRMVYSTCTLNRHENEDVVRRFVSEHDGYTLVLERTLFPDPVLPPKLRTDGFFYAVIEKK